VISESKKDVVRSVEEIVRLIPEEYHSLIPELIVACLNDARDCDQVALRDLVLTRVECNYDLADHPNIQVVCSDDDESKTAVGLLGMINGITIPLGSVVYAILDGEDEDDVSTTNLLGFRLGPIQEIESV
jgi:hypothetical protein